MAIAAASSTKTNSFHLVRMKKLSNSEREIDLYAVGQIILCSQLNAESLAGILSDV
jgi:hypothetical protein